MSPRDKGMARSLWNFPWTSKQFIRLKLKHKGENARCSRAISQPCGIFTPRDPYRSSRLLARSYRVRGLQFDEFYPTATCANSGSKLLEERTREARNKKSKTKRRKSPVAREIARDRFETCCQKRLCVFFFSFLFSPLGTLKFDTDNFVIELCSRYM